MAVVASCMTSEPEEMMNIVFGPQQEITIRASYGDPETRTERASDGSVLWSPGDQISLFYGSGTNGGSKFTAQNTETAKVVNFTGTIGVITGGNDVAMEDTYFWATYPYCAEASCDGSSITTVLPSAQVATADTFADDLFPSIGRSSGLTMGFYNICGGLKFTVSEEGIKSVTLQGHNNEVLAGKITVGLDADGKPEVTSIEDGSETIVLSAPAGESFQVGKSYYLVFVPTVFENGFTLTFTKESLCAVYDRTKKTTIRRSAFGSLTTPDANLEWDASNEYKLAVEREALIAIYNALDGDHWNNNENWCSDKPVSEWYGVTTDDKGFVYQLHFVSNNLSGAIPNDIGNLSKVNEIELSNEPNLSGPIPNSIGNLVQLSIFHVLNTGIEGSIPSSIAGCKELRYIEIVNNPKMQGPLPAAFYNLPNITSLVVSYQPSFFSGVFPIEICNWSYLSNLTLHNDSLKGTIPASIANLSHLYSLDLSYNMLEEGVDNIQNMSELRILDLNMNRFHGSIPIELATCDNLESVFLWGNDFTGSIPKEFGQCQHLRTLNLISNYLSGDIPSELGLAPNLTSIDFSQNCFKGQYPQWLLEDERFRDAWMANSYGNLFDLSEMPGPVFDIVDLDGVSVSSKDYGQNSYTILISATPDLNIDNIKELYNKYSSSGLAVYSLIRGWDIPSGINDEDARKAFIINQASEYISEFSIPWRCAAITYDNHVSHYMNQGLDVYDNIPLVTVINNQGKVVYYFSPFFCPTGYVLDDPEWNRFLYHLGETLPVGYSSSDFSMDGTIRTIQAATEGKGIDIVLLGDGFSDRMIESGLYDDALNRAADAFFEEEPYKSNRQLFNVYCITAVSLNEDYHDGYCTALNCQIDETSTAISADNAKCLNYLKKVLPEERIDDATVLVLVNKDTYAGTCYMYTNGSGDYGRGLSIGFVPTNSEDATFGGLVSHEIGGHGFAKLGDEYAYEDMGAFPYESGLPEGIFLGSVKDVYSQVEYGWLKNIDFTSDPAQVKWSRFLTDERYANEGLGCYEGGMTYWTGVWRPTENSIMRYNTGGFNAPSRYAIWYRIGKLAYGESWEGSYEDFVAYDQVNRTPVAIARRKAQSLAKPLPPLAPPVVVGHSWREAK